MSMVKNYTVPEVKELFEATVIDTFAATDEGQAHLNRIAKAITNESLVKRVASSQLTNAKKAFDSKLAKIATQTPDKVAEFVASKDTWIESYITRKYETVED